MEIHIENLYPPLLGYVKKRVHNPEDAEDLTQEVFYKLSKTDLSSIKSLKNWVFSIAKNSITDYYRKKKIQTTHEVENVVYPESYPQNQVTEELSKCVTHFIQQLPEEYRSIMILSELEGIPQKEIAAQLNMNYVTVRSKIQRGRKKLKAMFSACCEVTQGSQGSILYYKAKENTKAC